MDRKLTNDEMKEFDMQMEKVAAKGYMTLPPFLLRIDEKGKYVFKKRRGYCNGCYRVRKPWIDEINEKGFDEFITKLKPVHSRFKLG